MQSFDQSGQVRSRAIAGPPIFRQPFCELPKLGVVHLLSAAKDRLKRVPSRHLLIDAITGVCAPERRIGKIPLSGVKTIALVNENRLCCRKHKRLYVVVPVM